MGVGGCSVVKPRTCSLIEVSFARFLQERVVLVEQIDQAASLQMQAEREADVAMQQLEEFINGQEELVSSLPLTTLPPPPLPSHQISRASTAHILDTDV